MLKYNVFKGGNSMSAFFDRMAPYVIASGQTKIFGKWYPYRIVQQAFEPRLPGFIGLQEGELFISDDVPGGYREHFFWHEVRCVEQRQRKGCVETLKEELARVQPEIIRDYIQYRAECFAALVAFYADNPPEFFPEIAQSLEHLLGLLKA